MNPLLIVVDGISGSGKTSVIKAAERGLKAAGYSVSVHQWTPHKPTVIGRQRLSHYMAQVDQLDADIKEGRTGDVIICEGHPCIFEYVTNKTMHIASHGEIWRTLLKPDFVMLLSCLPAVCRQRIMDKTKCDPSKAQSYHDIQATLDGYANLTAEQCGTMNIYRAGTSTPEEFLFAGGDLRANVMQILRKKGLAA